MKIPGVEYVFLTRNLPGSTHVYTSVDAKLIAAASPASEVKKNLEIARENLGFSANRLSVLKQNHGTKVWVVDEKEPRLELEGDGQVTRTPRVALGILTADCAPVVLADAKRQIIGAAHAGWKGAFNGVLESTIERMVALGSLKTDIVAVIGPSISWDAYQVGPQFFARFVGQSELNRQFFKPSIQTQHYLFNLPGFVAHKLRAIGLKDVHDIGIDTFSNPKQYFSYRRQMQLEQRFQGNLLSAVMLAE